MKLGINIIQDFSLYDAAYVRHKPLTSLNLPARRCTFVSPQSESLVQLTATRLTPVNIYNMDNTTMESTNF